MTAPRAQPSRQHRAGRPRAVTGGPSTGERILAEATRLFAERGYDGVGMRDIAEACDLSVASVHHHAGSKADLHAAVFAGVHAAESAALTRAAQLVATFPLDTAGGVLAALHAMLDAYLDFLETHPHTTFLWLRRWLAPERHAELDDEFALPLYGLVEGLLARADAAGLVVEPTPHVAVRSVVWAAHAHVTALAARPMAADAERADFRGYAHRLLDALYGG